MHRNNNTFSKKTLLMKFVKLVQELLLQDIEMFSHNQANDLVIPCNHFVPQQEIQQHEAWVNS